MASPPFAGRGCGGGSRTGCRAAACRLPRAASGRRGFPATRRNSGRQQDAVARSNARSTQVAASARRPALISPIAVTAALAVPVRAYASNCATWASTSPHRPRLRRSGSVRPWPGRSGRFASRSMRSACARASSKRRRPTKAGIEATARMVGRARVEPSASALPEIVERGLSSRRAPASPGTGHGGFTRQHGSSATARDSVSRARGSCAQSW